MSEKSALLITERAFGSYLDCTYKAWLLINGHAGTQNLFEKHNAQWSLQYQIRAIDHLVAVYRPQEVYRKRLTDSDIAPVARGLIVLDRVTAEHIEAGPAVVCRKASGNAAPEPMYLYRYPNVTNRAKLMLGFRALVISRVSRNSPSHGVIVHGENFAETSLRLSPSIKKAEAILDRLGELASSQEPRLHLNPHCDICEFHEICKNKALEDDNMSVLQGMPPGYVDHMNKRGIFTLNQLSYTFGLGKYPSARKNRQCLDTLRYRPRQYGNSGSWSTALLNCRHPGQTSISTSKASHSGIFTI